MTMTLVSTVTVGSGGAATIEFSSIPQTGTDLLLVASLRWNFATTQGPVTVNFNSDATGSNYVNLWLRGSGSAASSLNSGTDRSVGYSSASNNTANTFGNAQIYIPNYSATGTKSFSADTVMETNATQAWQVISANKWSGTSAITSITLDGAGANWAQYSTASLYTITKGSGGATVS